MSRRGHSFAAFALALFLLPVSTGRAAGPPVALPPQFVQIQAGPDGGSVWQGPIPNTLVPNARRPTLVYLPPGVASGRRYPVVYLLQGFPGSPYEYVYGLELARRADELISGGELPPFIAVMPPAGVRPRISEGWTGVWEEYLVRDVVPWVDAHLPTRAGAPWRAIAGLSAGGYGAVDIGLRHPHLFGAFESWSGYFNAPRDGSLAHANAAERAAHDPLLLARREAPRLRRLQTRFFLSSGTTHDRAGDLAARAFAAELSSLGIPYRLWLAPGGHDGRLWRAQLPAALRYALLVPEPAPPPHAVRVWTIDYPAHDGLVRRAYVLLPRWYGSDDHPSIPLIISPHGRGLDAIDNARLWGVLPALGRFAVVNPEGQGRTLERYSWGDRGEIDDLAKMPRFVTRALPWLRIDRRRIYAFGGSMGGQETLLLVAHHPRLLAGAAAFDAPTNLALRYREFRSLPHGVRLQMLARAEVGGTPSTDAEAYRLRSPLDCARRIAFAGVPLQLWWSRRDRIVVDQAHETGLLYREIERLNPSAPVREVVGDWVHTAEMRPATRLPIALGLFHLVPPSVAHYGGGVRIHRTERSRHAPHPLAPEQHVRIHHP